MTELRVKGVADLLPIGNRFAARATIHYPSNTTDFRRMKEVGECENLVAPVLHG